MPRTTRALRRSTALVAVLTACALAVTLLLGLGTTATATAVAGASAGVADATGESRTVSAQAAKKKVKPAVKYRKQAQKATNKARKRHDRKKFRTNPCLRKWARKHAKRLARDNEGIWHQDLQPILKDCNLSMVGENVAAGYPTGKAVVNQGWMKSDGHRANILRRQFRLSVVEARKGDNGWWYAVQLFGRR